MKRVISVLLSLTIVLCGISVCAYSTNDYSNGDVDLNGTVDVNDVTAIQRYLIMLRNFTNNQEILADTDLNGKVNIMDATKIQRALAGTSELPADKVETDYTIDNNVPIYFKNNKKWSNVYFYIYNSKTDVAVADWPGTKMTASETDAKGNQIFTTVIDVTKYDRLIFTNGSQQTCNIPLTKASSGFSIYGGNMKSLSVDTFAYNGGYTGTLTTTSLEYSKGYNKKIWIWTPAGYDANSEEKYKTVYMCDGQNLFEDHSDGWGGWATHQTVECLMNNGGRGMVLVGIDNGNSRRDSELTPDLGEVAVSGYGDFSVRTGEAYSDFVVEKVMPYVQANYNSSIRREDNIVAGSSSGGLEAFYIGLEHKDKFAYIGALSPAILLFNEQVWDTYLSKYDFESEDIPKIYMFNGKGDQLENVLYSPAYWMYEELLKRGMDSEKITFVTEEAFPHNEGAWRVIFPDMLSWLLDL